MEEKKKQENDEIVREQETDKESCQQEEKACSEEKLETTENDKSAEETTDSEEINPDGTTEKTTKSSDQNKKPKDTLNNRDEREGPDDGDNKVSFREMLGKEVTWAAIAAIGGAIIAIWNIIRFIFIWFSSWFIYLKTNVPIYILMERKNLDFSDAYLIFATAIVILMIYAYTEYNVVPKKVIRCIEKLISISTPFILLWLAFFGVAVIMHHSLIRLFAARRYIYLLFVIGQKFVFLVCPIYFMLITIVIGRKYRWTLKEAKLTQGLLHTYKKDIEELKSNLAEKILDDRVAKIEKKMQEVEKEIAEVEILNGKITKIFRNLRRNQLFTICLSASCLLFGCSSPTYLLCDQYNRVIVADLGNRYIVQETKDDNNKIRVADRSYYYVIDSADEKLTIYRDFYEFR